MTEHPIDRGGWWVFESSWRGLAGGDAARAGGLIGQMIYQHVHAYILRAGLHPADFGLHGVAALTAT